MADDVAGANVNRSYQLAASSIAIFTFLLFFLYPKFVSGEVDPLPFQATLGGRLDDAERARLSDRGDRTWLLVCVLLFLTPSLILFTVGLLAVAAAWFALWLVYLIFVIRNFPRVRTARKG